jgi:hypothetical protein
MVKSWVVPDPKKVYRNARPANRRKIQGEFGTDETTADNRA